MARRRASRLPIRLSAVASALAALLAMGLVAPQRASAQQERPPTPVTVVTLKAQDVTLTTLLPGRVVASGVAEVRPQVDGIITQRLFEEGAAVAVGDPLYRIDSATYEAQVAAAKAQVTEANARLRAARQQFERVQQLVNRRVGSQSALDDAVAERDGAAASLQVAQASLLTAEINLERTTVRAPLSGVVGRSLTTQGALVTASQSQPLAVIRTLDPILVDVTQSAAEMLAWRRGQAGRKLEDADQTVRLILADGEPYELTGQLTAAEPHVDEQTGVVTLRMTFPNPAELLLPGMYVQVEMPQGVARDVVLAPQEGVSRDRRGRPIAMVVNADNVVESRTLTVIRARGSDWIVRDGLSDGDRLVVEGLQKIGPQMTVAPEERPATEAGPDKQGTGSQAATGEQSASAD